MSSREAFDIVWQARVQVGIAHVWSARLAREEGRAEHTPLAQMLGELYARLNTEEPDFRSFSSADATLLVTVLEGVEELTCSTGLSAPFLDLFERIGIPACGRQAAEHPSQLSRRALAGAEPDVAAIALLTAEYPEPPAPKRNRC